MKTDVQQVSADRLKVGDVVCAAAAPYPPVNTVMGVTLDGNLAHIAWFEGSSGPTTVWRDTLFYVSRRG